MTERAEQNFFYEIPYFLYPESSLKQESSLWD